MTKLKKLEKLTLDKGIFKNQEGHEVKVKILKISMEMTSGCPSFHERGPRGSNAYARGDGEDMGVMQPLYYMPVLYLKKL